MEKKIDLSDYQSKNNVGYCITKTAQYLKFSALATLKNVNVNDPLTLDQYGVLFALLQNNGIYQRQLGSVLLKDRPNTTRLVNILEEKKYIERREDPENKRKHRLYITQAGKEKINDLAPLKIKMVDKVLKGISQKEIDSLLSTLEKIRNNLEDDFTMQT